MGEIADMLIDGTLDSETGEYLGEGPGYPRTIHGRKRGKRYREQQFNDNQKMKGVVYYLYDKGILNSADAHKIIREYGLQMGIEVSKKHEVKNFCVEIQKDFKAFITWFNNNDEGAIK